MTVAGTSAFAGDTTTMSNGMAAPIENIAAEVSAACTGRAAVISDNPELRSLVERMDLDVSK